MKDETTSGLIVLTFVAVIITALSAVVACIQVFTDGLFG